MERYLNRSGVSLIEAYELGPQHIKIKFVRNAKIYCYSHAGVGNEHVEAMKQLASEGSGLAQYVAAHPEVKYGYDRI
ncbi:hypothetical protein [Robbsia sp. KACC 23696]|uniref:hypothetical protein n=1 Tax=Robbsia sp. KACC 23696 TaxID=3149231 RepID=UPI00325B631F